MVLAVVEQPAGERDDGGPRHPWSGRTVAEQAARRLHDQQVRGGLERDAVVPVLRRGDVTFHHCRTVRGSGPDRTADPRRSVAIHLQPGDNRHVTRRGADGELPYHRNDELVRTVDGLPDYTDPRISPVLWPVSG